MRIKVGCCGWPISLKKYGNLFSVTEIQKTFYKLPRPETVLRWRGQVEENFEFVIKVPQLITHPPSSPTYRKAGLQIPKDKKDRFGGFKPTSEVFEVFSETVKIASLLKTRLLLFQTPPSFKETDQNVENLRNFFTEIPRKDFVLLWEPRGDWNKDTLFLIFKELQLVHVVDPFKARPLYGDILYFRLHGRAKKYHYTYSDEELTELHEIIKRESQKKEVAYVLFNNTNMLKDAERFDKFQAQDEA